MLGHLDGFAAHKSKTKSVCFEESLGRRDSRVVDAYANAMDCQAADSCHTG